jgi:hypothetical protein
MSASRAVVALDAFCLRQFASGQLACEPAELVRRVNAHIEAQGGEQVALQRGYAPFCKHVFVDNFCGGECEQERAVVLAVVRGHRASCSRPRLLSARPTGWQTD